MKYDTIIVGAGVAGLYASRYIDGNKKVLIISKDDPWECNTFFAQGGVSVATSDEDSILHIEDTLRSGDGLCDKQNVETLVKGANFVINDLINLGFAFDRNENNELLFTKEAAHSSSRILHAGGDATGRYLHHFLLSLSKHTLLSNAVVVDLLLDNNIAYGVSVAINGVIENIYANNVILASGGIGALYEYHTNSRSISGDIQGIAVEKNIELDRMEMLQFHPTVFVKGNTVRKMLLSEALRGEGAEVEDEDGKRFLFNYDPRGELASRDIVSRAIFDYMEKTNSNIYLSFKNFTYHAFSKRFPNIFKTFHHLGFSVPDVRVPISPAFHYAIGGIKTDTNGKVKGYKNLFAIGEVASTRVHGANRLASNSLLEGLVYAKRCSLILSDKKRDKIFDIPLFDLHKEDDKKHKKHLRELMWKNVGIKRETKGLKEAQKTIEKMLQYDNGRLLTLRLLSAKKIVESALLRTLSVGVHFRNN
jgi:L-aspartate oxidase